MTKEKPARRPQAETPKGFRDYFGAEVTARKAMLDKIADVYHRYGFDPLETSAVETVEALGKFLPDVDRPNEGVFAWKEEADWLALRYDLTAPLARVAAQYRNDLPSPYRRYAMGPVWRNEKPGPGRFRQFYQCDADTVGSASVAADAEICMMLADALEAVGIERGDYVIKLNSRKVLNGVMEVAGVLDPSDPEKFAAERGIVLRAIDKLDRLGVEGVRALLGAGRKDESGDFTKGAGLAELQIDKIMQFVNAAFEVENKLGREAANAGVEGDSIRENSLHDARYSVRDELLEDREAYGKYRPIWNKRMLDHLEDLVKSSDVGWSGVNELRQITAIVEAMGYADHRFLIDPSVVRGLGYYTGPVYEAELTFEVQNDEGQTVRFGSVGGGGRYDDLVARFTGQRVPATGFSLGLSRLQDALRKVNGRTTGVLGPVVVLVMDRAELPRYQRMAQELRAAGIRAEMYLGTSGMKAQMKYADRRQSPCVVIQGSDERAKGEVQIKDLIEGAKAAADIKDNAEWKAARPAQFSVPEQQLTAAVTELLARHGG